MPSVVLLIKTLSLSAPLSARACELQFELQAARGYRMIGSCASVPVEYDYANRWIAKGPDDNCAAARTLRGQARTNGDQMRERQRLAPAP